MPQSLFSLAEDIRRCTACPLWKGRILPVPGEGFADAPIMVIGEAPGEQEDREGLPFVGRGGQFFMDLLESINVKRSDLFITNSVKCRPPKNRTPTMKECGECNDLWLQKQITLLNPKLIILVGGVAVRTCLGKGSVGKLHGTVITKEGRKYFVMYHPAAALRFPTIRKIMEKDLVTLKKVVGEI